MFYLDESYLESEEEHVPHECFCSADDYDIEEKSLYLVSCYKKRNVTLWEHELLDVFNEHEEAEVCSKDDEEFSEETPLEYLNKEVFEKLLQAVVEMLQKANDWNLFQNQRSRCNALDILSEILWNQNSLHPNRSENWLNVFEIPPFKLWLKSHPRPIYPKSWIWTKDEGATNIQRWVRGWIVRKQINVQEMRKFWKVMRKENELKLLRNKGNIIKTDICQQIKQQTRKMPVLSQN